MEHDKEWWVMGNSGKCVGMVGNGVEWCGMVWNGVECFRITNLHKHRLRTLILK